MLDKAVGLNNFREKINLSLNQGPSLIRKSFAKKKNWKIWPIFSEIFLPQVQEGIIHSFTSTTVSHQQRWFCGLARENPGVVKKLATWNFKSYFRSFLYLICSSFSNKLLCQAMTVTNTSNLTEGQFYYTFCCKVVQYSPGAVMSTRTARVNSKRFIFTASYLCRN